MHVECERYAYIPLNLRTHRIRRRWTVLRHEIGDARAAVRPALANQYLPSENSNSRMAPEEDKVLEREGMRWGRGGAEEERCGDSLDLRRWSPGRVPSGHYIAAIAGGVRDCRQKRTQIRIKFLESGLHRERTCGHAQRGWYTPQHWRRQLWGTGARAPPRLTTI